MVFVAHQEVFEFLISTTLKPLWMYHHSAIKLDDHASANASFYVIREHFKSRNKKGRTKTKSNDEGLNEFDSVLRSSLKALAATIAPKVYQYDFFKK